MESALLAQLGTTNLLLGVLAAVAVIELLIIGVLAFWLRRSLLQVSHTIDQLTTSHVVPTLARIRQVSDKASDVLAGAEAIVSRVTGVADVLDERVRSVASRVGRVTSAVDRVTSRYHLQIRALEAGLGRGLTALRHPHTRA